MADSVEQVLQAMDQGQFSPVYFLSGEEAYFIDLLAKRIENEAIPEAERSFNQMVFYGKEVSIPQLLGQARRFPMMGERQVIVVREAQEIPDFGKEDSQKMLETYLKSPQPSTVLAFCYKHKKLDKRKSIGKALQKHTVFIDAKRVYDNQMPAWVQQFVVGKGYKITEKAKMMLTENIGTNLERMSNELQKVFNNYPVGTEIDEKAVQEHVGISKDFNTFELQKAIAFGDFVKANRIINYFESDPKNHPIFVTLASLFRYFTKVLLLHHQGVNNDKEASKVIGVHWFLAKEYLVAKRNYSLPAVMGAIHYIREADMHAKGVEATGALTHGQIMQELLYKIMRKGR